MSASKLLKRLVQSAVEIAGRGFKSHDAARELHNATFGISSDPLMQFSAVFSCLMCNVDHSGLTNNELIQLKTPTAVICKNKAVAEQIALDIA